jgi:hypothetical protein
MRHAGAAITTSESILFQLMDDAKHPNFKQISQMVQELREKDRANHLFFRKSNF